MLLFCVSLILSIVWIGIFKTQQMLLFNITPALTLLNSFSFKLIPSLQISPSYVDGPLQFYVQLVALQKPIEDLSEKVNAYYLSNPSDKPNLTVDSYCAAEWNGDWYVILLILVCVGNQLFQIS